MGLTVNEELIVRERSTCSWIKKKWHNFSKKKNETIRFAKHEAQSLDEVLKYKSLILPNPYGNRSFGYFPRSCFQQNGYHDNNAKKTSSPLHTFSNEDLDLLFCCSQHLSSLSILNGHLNFAVAILETAAEILNYEELEKNLAGSPISFSDQQNSNAQRRSILALLALGRSAQGRWEEALAAFSMACSDNDLQEANTTATIQVNKFNLRSNNYIKIYNFFSFSFILGGSWMAYCKSRFTKRGSQSNVFRCYYDGICWLN